MSLEEPRYTMSLEEHERAIQFKELVKKQQPVFVEKLHREHRSFECIEFTNSR